MNDKKINIKNTDADRQIYISQENVNSCEYQIKNFLILFNTKIKKIYL